MAILVFLRDSGGLKEMIGSTTRQNNMKNNLKVLPCSCVEVGSCVEVIWFDSSFSLGWRYGEKPAPMPPLTTLGKVTYLDAQQIEISSTFGNNGALNPLTLPWGAIQSIRVLRGSNGNR